MDTKVKLRSILQIILYKYPLLYPASLYLFNNAIILDSKEQSQNLKDDTDIITNSDIKFVATMAVDNLGKLYVNKKFFDSLDINTALFVYLHEVLHFVFKHIDTYIEHILPKYSNSGVDQAILLHLANLGMDMAVNSMLSQDLNIKIENAVYPEDFDFEPLKSFEYYFINLLEKFKNDQEFKQAIQYFVQQILEEIKKQLQQNSNCNNSNCQSNSQKKSKKKNSKDNCNSNGNSNNINSNNSKNGSDDSNLSNNKYYKKLKEYFIDEHLFERLVREELRKQLNDTIKRLMEQGLILHQNSQKNIGNGIAEILREYLEDQYKPKVNWKNLLKIHLDIVADNRKRSFIRPNRKISSYIAPGYIEDYIESINPCILIDLSGSIADEEFTQFINELLSLFKTYKMEKIRFIAFTDGVVFDKTFELAKDEEIDKNWLFKNINFNYTGGTSIEESLKRFEEDKELSVGIVFTDCEIDDWYKIKNPNKHLFVISTTKKKAPFYKTIHL